jgi:hypothetical protein
MYVVVSVAQVFQFVTEKPLSRLFLVVLIGKVEDPLAILANLVNRKGCAFVWV